MRTDALFRKAPRQLPFSTVLAHQQRALHQEQPQQQKSSRSRNDWYEQPNHANGWLARRRDVQYEYSLLPLLLTAYGATSVCYAA